MTGFSVEPTGRDDEWEWQLVRQADSVVVGWFMTHERAQAAADNGGEPPAPPVEDRPLSERDDQLELFGAAA